MNSSFNPLSANEVYSRDDTVVTSNSCNSAHSENYNICKIEIVSLNFLENGIQNIVVCLIHSWEIALQISISIKKTKKGSGT